MKKSIIIILFCIEILTVLCLLLSFNNINQAIFAEAEARVQLENNLQTIQNQINDISIQLDNCNLEIEDCKKKL